MSKQPPDGLAEEIRTHIELEIERRIEAGEEPDQARRNARRRFGNLLHAEEDVRAVWRPRWREDLGRDLALAWRSLRRTPGMAILAVISLALGIGANAAVFSVVRATLLRPLPYEAPERLIRLWETYPYPGGRGTGTVSVPNWEDWRAQSRSFEAMGGYAFRSFNLSGDGDAIRVSGAALTPEILPMLGLEPLEGRFFSDDESEPGRDRVALVGHELWWSRFGGESLVGREIVVDGELRTVIGILPPEFEFPSDSGAQLWTPLAFTAEQREARGSHWMHVLGRLRDDASLEQARAEMETIAARLAAEHPEEQRDRSVELATLLESLTAGLRPALLALWGAVALVLVIGCANAANLLLARAAARRRDYALRAALGAGRWRIGRQVLAESGLLALAGGLLGLALAAIGAERLARAPGSGAPTSAEFGVDWLVFGFCLAVALVSTLLAGSTPAWRAAKVDPQRDLRAAGAGRTQSGPRDRLRSALVAGQIAMAVVVLVGAGLLLRSYRSLQQVDPGFRTERLLTFRLQALEEHAPDPKSAGIFYERLLERVRRLPGVEQAGVVNLLPLRHWGSNGNFEIRGRSFPPGSEPFTEYRVVSPGFFEALEIPLLEGRRFSEQDHFEAPWAAIINQKLARTYWPDESPIGAQIGWGDDFPWMTVVGVVGDIHDARLSEAVSPTIYYPNAQFAHDATSLVVRAQAAPASLTAAIRQALREIDPQQAIFEVATMSEVVDRSLRRPRFQATLYSLFALLALALAVTGVFGVVSYGVGRRTREIGVRMALGARRAQVARLVLAQGLGLAGMGILGGLAVALLLTRWLESQLFGVGRFDPPTLAAVAALIAAAALTASYLPARRAARLRPMDALREE